MPSEPTDSPTFGDLSKTSQSAPGSAESVQFAPEYLDRLLSLSVMERTTHYAVLCRCHRELWGPLCAPFQHGTVPLILDVDAAKRAVTCVYCRADMEKRGLLDGR